MSPSPSSSRGGASEVSVATVILTNAQVKTLRATPVVIASPSTASKAVIAIGVTLILDDRNGVYIDGDGTFNGSLDYMPNPKIGNIAFAFSFDLSDAGIGAPGPGVYPAHISPGTSQSWGLLESGGAAPGGTLGIAKKGAGEYSGGGAGNTLTVHTVYFEVPLS